MNRASAVVAAVLSTATLGAQEPGGLTSGPPAGTPLPRLPVYAPDGPQAGLDLDVTELIGTGPGAVLFVHELTRNVAPLVRGLDVLADSHAALGLTTAVVMLAADRTEAERRAPAASRSLRLARPMLVSVDGLEGPGAWALSRRATLTLVLCNGGAVVESVAFTDTGRQDLPRLRALVETVTGPVPESPGELRRLALERLPADPGVLRARALLLGLELHWRALRIAEEEADRARRDQAERRTDDQMAPRARTRPDAAGDAPARRGAAPTDEDLRTLFRASSQKDAAAATLDDVFAKIRARAGESTDLAAQVDAMFELMISLDLGTDDARGRARAWIDARKKR